MSASRNLSIVCVCVTVCALSGFSTGPAWAQGPPDDEVAVKVAKKFIKLVIKGDIEEANEFLGEAWAREMREHKEDYWKPLKEKTAGFRSFGEASTEVIGNRVLVTLPVRFENGEMILKVIVNADEEIDRFKYDSHMLVTKEGKPLTVEQLGEFTEKDVSFGKDPWKIEGKLTRPKGKKAVPAVVLVHGSGPHDEDETIGPNKPFRDLAEGLSSRGVAVLRYQKRTFAHKDQLKEKETITVREEVIDDALEALKFLRRQKGIDKNHIYLLGHSLGGTLAPQIAAEDKKLAGVIIMAGTPRDLLTVVEEQLKYIASLPGPQQEANKKAMKECCDLIAKVRSGSAPKDGNLLGAPLSYWKEVSEYATKSPQVLASLDCRAMVIGGGRDYQVTREDFDLYGEALKEHGKAKLQWYDEMNHLFVKGKGKATPAEYAKPCHVSKKVIRDLADWIKE